MHTLDSTNEELSHRELLCGKGFWVVYWGPVWAVQNLALWFDSYSLVSGKHDMKYCSQLFIWRVRDYFFFFQEYKNVTKSNKKTETSLTKVQRLQWDMSLLGIGPATRQSEELKKRSN